MAELLLPNDTWLGKEGNSNQIDLISEAPHIVGGRRIDGRIQQEYLIANCSAGASLNWLFGKESSFTSGTGPDHALQEVQEKAQRCAKIEEMLSGLEGRTQSMYRTARRHWASSVLVAR